MFHPMSNAAPSGPSVPPGAVQAPGEPQPQGFLMGLLRDWGIALAVVLVVFAGYNIFFGHKPPALGPAPDFSLSDLDGQSISLSMIDARADLVVLNFWFTTCPPCRAEIPELSGFAKDHPDIPLYGVSTDVGMPTARLKAESARLGVAYPVLHDARADVARQYGIDTFPTTLVIRDGEIVQAKVGRLDRATLESMVAAAQ